MTVSETLFVVTLPVLRITSQIFCGISLNLDLSDVFLMVRLGLMSFGEGDHRCKMPPPSHHFKGTHHQYGLSRSMLTVIICLEAGFVGFLYCKIIIFFTFSIHFTLEESPYLQLILKECELCFKDIT